MKVNLQTLGRSVKRLQARHHRMLEARLVEIGSTLAQWDALRAISQNPGASSHDLAEYTFQTDQSFGALAERLVARGLVTRTAGKGRALRHGLTAQGKRVLVQANRAADVVLAESFAPLTEAERIQFLALIARLLRQGSEEPSV
jgi:DNA-binding MarR family transcriptional regulator